MFPIRPLSGDPKSSHRRLVILLYLAARLAFLAISGGFVLLLSLGKVELSHLTGSDIPEIQKAWLLFLVSSFVLCVLAYIFVKKKSFSLADTVVALTLLPDGYAVFLAAKASGGSDSILLHGLFFLIAVHSYHFSGSSIDLYAPQRIIRYVTRSGGPRSIVVAMTVYFLLLPEGAPLGQAFVEFGFQAGTALAFMFLRQTHWDQEEELLAAQDRLAEHTRAEADLHESMRELMNLPKLATVQELYAHLESVAERLGKSFDAEYCAIGLCFGEVLEDVAFWTSFPMSAEVRDALYQVRRGTLENTFVGSVLLQESGSFYWDQAVNGDLLQYTEGELDRLDLRVLRSSAEAYRTKLLPSGSLSHILVIPLYHRAEEARPLGYVHLLNRLGSDGALSPIGFSDSSRETLTLIAEQLSLAVGNFRHHQEDLAIAEEDRFLNQLTQTADLEELVSRVLQYVNKQFDGQVASLWLPTEDGFGDDQETRKLVLRSVEVSTKGRSAEDSENLKKILSADSLQNLSDCVIGRYVASPETAEVQYFEDCRKHENCWGEFNKEIGSTHLLSIPIRGTVVERESNDRPILGVICVRPTESLSLPTGTRERLDRFASHLAILLERVRFLTLYQQIEALRVGLDDLYQAEPGVFYRRLAVLVRDLLRVEACSIFFKNPSKNALALKASSAPNAFSGIGPQAREFSHEEAVDRDFYSLDLPSITGEIFKRGATALFFNAEKNPLFNPAFMEATPSVEHGSLIASPILSAAGEKLGVLRCVNKREEGGLLRAFVRSDKDFMNLLTGLISRVIESAELDAAKRNFLTQLAHEFNSPLNALHTQIDFVEEVFHNRRTVRSPAQEFEYLRDQTSLLAFLIRDIQLQFGRAANSTVNYNFAKRIDLAAALEKIKKLLMNEARLDRQIDIITGTSRLPGLFCDQWRMEQVFFNLVQNAVKYSWKGRKDIFVGYEEGRKKDGSKWHEIAVENWGIGVPDDEEELIFQEYKRGSNASKVPSGTGLGLAVSRRVVENHGGQLCVESLREPTIFVVRLPWYLGERRPAEDEDSLCGG